MYPLCFVCNGFVDCGCFVHHKLVCLRSLDFFSRVFIEWRCSQDD